MIITLFSNTSWSLYNFRKDFILKLLRENHKVKIISNTDETTKHLMKMGCKFIPIKFDHVSKNPIKEFLFLTKLFFLILKTSSDIYVNFTIKPCIYFGLINFFFKKKSISLFDGLGRSLIKESYLSKLIILLLKFSQKNTNRIILVNKDDINFFFQKQIVKNKKKIFYLKAPGLNVDNFKFKKRLIGKKKILTFSFISRVMKEKGIIIFLRAAEKIKSKFKSNFVVVGKIESNEINKILKVYERKKVIKYYKNQKKVKPKILESDCIVLPSYYREGLPRILQESNYYGRICITTNNVGCKDVIINDFNGFLCKKNSTLDLTKKIEKVILMDRKKISKMESKGHYFIKKNFDKKVINKKFVKLINEINRV